MIAPTARQSLVLLLLGAGAVLIAALLVFGGVLPPYKTKPLSEDYFAAPTLDYRLVRFSDLDGWLQDDAEPALKAFLRSCALIEDLDEHAAINPYENLGPGFQGASLSGRVGDWLGPCATGARLEEVRYSDPSARRSAIRRFFEIEFRPIQILNQRAPLAGTPAAHEAPMIDEFGLFTGYYEPAYPAARTPSNRFSAPVHPRPDDLIDVDLGAFRDDLAGETIAGRIDGARLVPYADRRDINNGALSGKTAPIAWMAPDDLFFLQIQGSGQLVLQNGQRLRVGYAGKNGHIYTAIGASLIARGAVAREDMSMQAIRDWLKSASPEDAEALREENASYVFFKELDGLDEALGPPGAQGAPLTPERSLAVDRRYHALIAPVWVDIEPVLGNGPSRIRRLMIAQDTGGAIRGPVRGDVFWGAGARAELIAGAMKARGRFYVLAPLGVAEALAERQVGR